MRGLGGGGVEPHGGAEHHPVAGPGAGDRRGAGDEEPEAAGREATADAVHRGHPERVAAVAQALVGGEPQGPLSPEHRGAAGQPHRPAVEPQTQLRPRPGDPQPQPQRPRGAPRRLEVEEPGVAPDHREGDGLGPTPLAVVHQEGQPIDAVAQPPLADRQPRDPKPACLARHEGCGDPMPVEARRQAGSGPDADPHRHRVPPNRGARPRTQHVDEAGPVVGRRPRRSGTGRPGSPDPDEDQERRG